jgi:hypothetical protein
MNNVTHGAPPIAVGNSVIVGSKIFDYSLYNRSPPGHVRAYDAYTGAFKWRFKTIPQQGEPFTQTWEDNAWREAGNTNVWTFMSADDEAGIVYLPTSTPTNDYWGRQATGVKICSPNPWSPWTRKPENGSGIFRPYIMGCGTTTWLPLRTWLTSWWMGSPSRRWPRSPKLASPTCLIASLVNPCGQSKNGRCPRVMCRVREPTPPNPFQPNLRPLNARD